jgi:ABC-type transport system substrate-binding protein
MDVLRRRPRTAARAWLIAALAVCAALAAAAALAASWADPAKTLRVMFPIAETGFDPQASQDYYSSNVIRQIFDALYSPDYLARPYRLAPNTAEAMPDISTDGLTWTIRIKRGIHFADDPAFSGNKRELVAADYVYSWKRLVDPKMRSPNAYYIAGKLVGLDAAVEKAKASGRFDYDTEIEGLRAVDRYTIRLKLVEADYTLFSDLSQTAMAAVAREVVDKYGDASTWVMAHPVGTGPYRLAEWRRGQRIVLEANPNYREEYFPAAGDGSDEASRTLAANMKGKRLPQIGRVEISIIEESNPQLLAFDSKALDYVNVPSDLVPKALDANNKLLPDYTKQAVMLHRALQPALQFTYFNMDDPVIGGYTPDKIALRRAIVMGFNTPELIRVWYQGQAIQATQPVPPDVDGHVPGFDAHLRHDPAAARALLDKLGYRDRDGDGFRELPDGKPLMLSMGSVTSGRGRELDELWKKSMNAIGVRIDFVKQKWPDLLKMARAGQLQMWQVGWITTSGDGDAFMALLYGPNAGTTNLARFRNGEYDALYRRSKRLPHGPERQKLYAKMAQIAAAYNPWEPGVNRYENTLVRPWVLGYRKHIYVEHAFKYLDLDGGRSAAH